MEQAQSELDSGDLIQASKTAWKATAQIIKALGKRRGWQHEREFDYVQIIGRLVETTGRRELMYGLHAAQALKTNFYEGWMSEAGVRDSMDYVRQLVAELDAMITEED